MLFSVFAVLPTKIGLGWGNEALFVLKGIAPILAAFVGLVVILIGIADIRDMQEAKREEQEALDNAKKSDNS